MNFLSIDDTELVFFLSIGFVLVVILLLTIVGNIKKAKYKKENKFRDDRKELTSQSKSQESNESSNNLETINEASLDESLEDVEQVQTKNNNNIYMSAHSSSNVTNLTEDDTVITNSNEELVNDEEPVEVPPTEDVSNSLQDKEVEEENIESNEDALTNTINEEDSDVESTASIEETNETDTEANLEEKAEETSETIEDPNSNEKLSELTDTSVTMVESKKKNINRSYNGKYEVFQEAGGYRYCLKASNGEILVTSETYTSRDGVIKAIANVKKNIETGTIKIFADKKGKFKFKLISKNFRVLVVSSSYTAEKSAIRAAESFKKFALKADTIDVEVKDNDIKASSEITITNTENKLGGKFEIEKFDGEFSWDLKASNGQILCQADGYTTKAGCMYSIETFKKNIETGTFKCVKDKNNRYFYKLYTNQNRVCAIGESYDSKQAAESAANSVSAFYKNAEIIEVK